MIVAYGIPVIGILVIIGLLISIARDQEVSLSEQMKAADVGPETVVPIIIALTDDTPHDP